MAWWAIGYGKMNRQLQGDFERAIRLAQERQLPVRFTLEITVAPPRKDDPNYQPVAYKRKFAEPTYKSNETDLSLRNGIAVADAAQQPDQTVLELTEEEGRPALRVHTQKAVG
jgi:hypothetical protein